MELHEPGFKTSACYCVNVGSGRLLSWYSKAYWSLVSILTATHTHFILISVTNLLSLFS